MFITPVRGQISVYSNKHEARIKTNGIDSLYSLPHHFLIPGTVHLACDSVTYGEHLYIVDRTKGTLIFEQPPDSGKQFLVTYRALPLNLQINYRHWQAVEPDTQKKETVPVLF